MVFETFYDVIVVGGGHAGTEAALAAARMGARTLLLTHHIDLLGQMSCNPAIGGIGKGHLVREIDALDGAMALAADKAGIHFRTLNVSKGPAVRATRAQTCRSLYRQAIRAVLEHQKNLSIFQQPVEKLIVSGERVAGVETAMGLAFRAKAVVLTVGTFLLGKIHTGPITSQGGRAGCPPSVSLATHLRELGFPVMRLKTGTPPRIDGRTIDYSVMTSQPGDLPSPVFSFMGDVAMHPQQVLCHITHTTEKTHEIIRDNLETSPIYSGAIESTGPRYCPSIEDKVVRFSEKLSHQIFVEPEGLNTTEVYPNGISTSLPFSVQVDFVRTIKGFENAHITRPGYAIEYDCFDPRGLTRFLQTKLFSNLFFAGQINGTTGYEEAAAQGLIAGINSARWAKEESLWCPGREEAYIGVLIDDLVTRGTEEPYRMFTSRAEYRLLLREDNADLRLTEIGYDLGVVGASRFQAFSQKKEALVQGKSVLHTTWVRAAQHAEAFSHRVCSPIVQDCRAADFLKRPEVTYALLVETLGLPTFPEAVAMQLETEAKYEGYITRSLSEIERLKQHEAFKLPEKLDYTRVSGLSSEIVQKLTAIRPTTLGQAKRISGVTPAALSLLLVYLKKHKVSS